MLKSHAQSISSLQIKLLKKPSKYLCNPARDPRVDLSRAKSLKNDGLGLAGLGFNVGINAVGVQRLMNSASFPYRTIRNT